MNGTTAHAMRIGLVATAIRAALGMRCGMVAAMVWAAGVVGMGASAWGQMTNPCPPACSTPMKASGFTRTVSDAFPNWFPYAPVHQVNGQPEYYGNVCRDTNIGLGMSPWYGPGSAGLNLATAADVECTQQRSACWRIDEHSPAVIMNATRPLWGNTRGFPMNLDFYNLPATTNYPPLSREAWAGTAPMVSVAADRANRPQFLADRKLVAGVVDPITGQPLIREEDLSLPFGHATWRLIRTYGGNADGSSRDFYLEGQSPVGGQGDRLAIGKYWDWAGTGWMISENPILLFDAQYIQHEPSLPRRCYLILDAHHSIPFTQDIQTGNYAAPGWFDAVLTCDRSEVSWSDGQWRWDDPGRGGTPFPREVKVKLYGESVTYTFTIDCEEDTTVTAHNSWPADIVQLTVPPGFSGPMQDAHASPRIEHPPSGEPKTVVAPKVNDAAPGGGLGTPYLGFLKKIEDRFGNRAEITHAGNRKRSLGNAGDACRSCVQTCAEKGQIRTVKLYRAGEGNIPEWTMLYVHRSFRTWAPDATGEACRGGYLLSTVSSVDAESRWLLQNAVHAVYVYKHTPRWGASAGEPGDEGWTLPADAFVGEHAVNQTTGRMELDTTCPCYSSLDKQDEMDWTEGKIAAYLNWTVPSNWTYRMRYTYDETIVPARCQSLDATPPEEEVVTWFGSTAAVPPIFHWGTPLQRESGSGVWFGTPRVNPCLLRVERSDKPNPDRAEKSTSRTGYLYATPEDDGMAMLDRTDTSHVAVAADRGEHLPVFQGHFDERVTPKLRHILREDRLRRAMEYNGATTINSVFDPAPNGNVADATVSRRPNQRSYSAFANVSFDWHPLSHVIASTTPYGHARQIATPWVRNGLLANCVLSQVERGRLFIRSRSAALVQRVRIREGGGADGLYDLMYMSVDPQSPDAGGPFPAAGYWDNHAPALPPGLRTDSGLGAESNALFGDVPDTYTLFPFSWRRLAKPDNNSFFASTTTNPSAAGYRPLLPASPMDQPMFVTLVDRHDGTCVGAGPRSGRKPYMLRWLLNEEIDGNIENAQREIILPHQREVVGLNAAGFVLFDRNWDYQSGGIKAVGPTEEFIYEQLTEPRPLPNGGTVALLTGMRLTEHRSLGWGVAYVNSVQQGGCNPCITADCLANSRGLVTLFDYLDKPVPGPYSDTQRTTLVQRVRIKEGSGRNQPTRTLSELDYDLDTEQVRQERRYLLDPSGIGGTTPTMATRREVTWHTSDTPNTKIKTESVWQAAARPWPGGPLMTPFETKV